MKNMLTSANKKIILMMSLLASTAVLISCGEDDGVAAADPSTVNAGFTSEVDLDDSFTYTFTNASVILGIDDVTGTYAWDFGGDGTSTDANPTHTFSAAGDYTVTLTVTATDGETGTATETISVTAPKNKWAAITDTSTDTGELRLQLSDSIRNGRMTFNYLKETGSLDAFISLCGPSTTGDLMIAEVRFKNSDSGHEWREGATTGDAGTAAFPTPKNDVWVAVEVSWVADGVNAPTFSITIDGTAVATDVVSTTNGGEGDVADHLEATKYGLKNLQWKYHQGTAEDPNALTYNVDDIIVYSSDSGSEVVAFEDDFQGYQEGTDLNPGDNAATPYHANTFDATVAEEE